MDNRTVYRRTAALRRAAETEAANSKAMLALNANTAARRRALAERLLASSDWKALEFDGATGRPTRIPNSILRELDLLRSLPDDHYESREAMMRLLTNPLDAMLGAWYYKRDKEMPSSTFAAAFAFALCTSCSGTNHEHFGSLRGALLDAFPVFAKTLNDLVQTWKKYRPDGVRWLEAHQNEYRKIQKAQARCSIAITVPDVNTGPSLTPLKIRWLHRQRTYPQAAKTAALVLWGDFLSDKSQSVDFCLKCLKPFAAKSNKQFCAKACATNTTSLASKKGDLRRENGLRLHSAAENLAKWLSVKKRHGDWRRLVDPYGRAGRRSRWLAGFIQAALAPGDSGMTEKQFELCFDNRQGGNARAKARVVFDKFLADIREAEKPGPTSGGFINAKR